MVSPGSTGLLGAFELAARTGDPSRLTGAYAPDARLEAASRAGPIHNDGPDEIVHTLGTWWSEPTGLPVWQPQITSDGFLLVVERSGGDERLRRQRRWVHVHDGRIVRQIVFCDRPRYGVALPDPGAEPSLLHRAVRRAPLPHLGKAGNIIERAELDDGRILAGYQSSSTSHRAGAGVNASGPCRARNWAPTRAGRCRTPTPSSSPSGPARDRSG